MGFSQAFFSNQTSSLFVCLFFILVFKYIALNAAALPVNMYFTFS